MNKISYLAYAVALTALIACGDEKTETKEVEQKELTELQERAKTLFGELPELVDNPENPITEEKVILGKQLYFDVRLSKDNTQSCNTCHNLNTFGVDNLPTSPGNDGKNGTRNSPTVLNAALHTSQFWDGRNKDVEEQAGGPILNPVEMAMPSEEFVIERLSEIEEYKALFAKAFPEEEQPITYKNLQKAIGAFERKLITPSKFDDYLAGNDEALNEQEKRGLETFMTTGCITCHSGNALGGQLIQKFGLFGNYWELTKSEKIDEGRFEVTQNEADKYFFKSPSLRNIEKTYPYFHDGSMKNLDEAVKIMAKLQLNKELTDKETNDIIAFLKTLTGDVPQEFKQ
ncbi:MAG: cytochrome C peroxidase [Flavobacteriales bacterium BRH_c54]|nr:MAG: cytochrome C peroxidase [Flavobacteriales bacterium BRH_c54]